MIADGIWSTRRERRKAIQQPRRRRACLGELVQIDGCDHEWFETRGPRCTLLVYVDDATSRIMELYFARSESTFDYFEATRRYLRRHGKPVALYSDKAGVFRVNAKDPKAGDGFTQFGRAMHDLNIEVICANSPAAKGRVERAHQTLQDRLVKELRLRDISTMAAANLYAATFAEDYCRRFSRVPQSAHDAHRPLLKHDKLDHVLTWQEQRRVTDNLTLHYKRVMYLLDKTECARAAAGKYVVVRESEDGRVVIEHKGVALPARSFVKDARVQQGDIVSNKLLGTALLEIQRKQLTRDALMPSPTRVTLREEDLALKAMMGEPGLPQRRAMGRPTIAELAQRRIAAEAAAIVAPGGAAVVDQLVAQALRQLERMPLPAVKMRPSAKPAGRK